MAGGVHQLLAKSEEKFAGPPTTFGPLDLLLFLNWKTRSQRTAVRRQVQFGTSCRCVTCRCLRSQRVSSGSSTAYSQLPEQRGVQTKTRLKLHSEEYPVPTVLFSLEATLGPCSTRPRLRPASAAGGEGSVSTRACISCISSCSRTAWQPHGALRTSFCKSWRENRFSLPAPGPAWPPVVSHLGCRKHKQSRQ